LNILNEFDSITLQEMENVKLMDRIDTKFMFHVNTLNDILKSLSSHYLILEINGNKISTYNTVYFDTNEFDLYNKHHAGKLNRYKIRHRTYVESNLGFLEIKFKNNKGRTIKSRIEEKAISAITSERAILFLNKTLPISTENLQPKVWISYERITLVNKTTTEKITLDLNLKFQNNLHQKTSIH